MDESIRFEKVIIGFPNEAPVITDWLCKEIERWIQITHHQETTVEIAFQPYKEKS